MLKILYDMALMQHSASHAAQIVLHNHSGLHVICNLSYCRPWVTGTFLTDSMNAWLACGRLLFNGPNSFTKNSEASLLAETNVTDLHSANFRMRSMSCGSWCNADIWCITDQYKYIYPLQYCRVNGQLLFDSSRTTPAHKLSSSTYFSDPGDSPESPFKCESPRILYSTLSALPPMSTAAACNWVCCAVCVHCRPHSLSLLLATSPCGSITYPTPVEVYSIICSLRWRDAYLSHHERHTTVRTLKTCYNESLHSKSPYLMNKIRKAKSGPW